MKKAVSYIFTFLWLALLSLLGIYYLFLAPREPAYSPAENRNLAGFPAVSAERVLTGQFGKDFETYLEDRFPGRDRVIAATNQLKSALSLATIDEYLLIAQSPEDALDSEVNEEAVDDLLAELEQRPTEPPETEPPEATDPSAPAVPTEPPENPPIKQKPAASLEDYPNRVGIYMNTGGSDYAVYETSSRKVAAMTALLNKYARLLPKNGKLMFTMVPQSAKANRYVNARTQNSFYSTWDDIINGLGDNNVYAFDTPEILAPAIENGEYVYFRTDMHWNPYGSYLVYAEMAKRAGKVPCSYEEDFTLTVEEPFRGTYYRDYPGDYGGVKADRLDLLMPVCGLEWRRITGPNGEYKLIDFLNHNARQNDRYTVYLGGPAGPWTYAQCDNGETENCLLITDSFGLGYLPFLTANYGQVHYYDPRYFNEATVGCSVAEMIEKYNIQDIYVVVGDLHSFDSDFLLTDANSELGE
jgi:hypothetical protein